MKLTRKSGHWDPKHVDIVNQHEAKAQDRYYSSKYTTVLVQAHGLNKAPKFSRVTQVSELKNLFDDEMRFAEY